MYAPEVVITTSQESTVLDIRGYTGELELPPQVLAFLEVLDREGFAITPSGRSKTSERKGTLRIDWNKKYVAYIGDGTVETGALFGYQFFPGMKKKAKNRCPEPFDLRAFCREHVCSESDVHLMYVRKTGIPERYLHVRDAAFGLRLLRKSAAAIDGRLPSPEDECDDSLQDDMAAIRTDASVTDTTTREALIQARLGQGKFRQDVGEKFGWKCAVSQLRLRPALRASHILPWKLANNEQRLDPENGLLLAANVDALFDRTLITFRPDGTLVVSATISASDRKRLGPLGDLRVIPTPKQADYLILHNRAFEELETSR